MYRKSFQTRILAATLFGVAMFAATAAAQVQSGVILGNVYDQSGAVIPGASVTAVNKATGQRHKTSSDGTGLYSLPSLPYGDYSVETSIQGFQTAKKDLISLHADTKVKVDFTLSPGSVEVRHDGIGIQPIEVETE